MPNSDDFLKELEEFADEEDTCIFKESKLEEYSDFFKESENSKVWWIDKMEVLGEHFFSFDCKKIYNLFADYPHNLTAEEVEMFNAENPFWVDYFKNRLQ